MKTLIAFLCGVVFAGIIAAKVVSYEPRNGTAEVNQEKGFLIFIDCTPVKKYTVLGQVKKRANWSGSGQFDDVKNDLLDKAKRKYPQGQGLLFSFRDGGTDMVDVIKFD